MRKKIKQVVKKVPGVNELLQLKTYNHILKLKDEQIGGLQESVVRLEARNDEWAREVRELRGEGKPMEILWPVTVEDLVAADHTKKRKEKLSKPKTGARTLNWVVPPVGSVSGGHAVIFRTIRFLESAGYKCRVYFYDPMHQVSFEDIKNNLKNHHKIDAELYYNEKKMLDCDGVFATGWTTAYPVYNFSGYGKKFYFIQDYEPMFEAAGTYSTLAENTYKMGLHGVSTSPWTARKLQSEFDMKVDAFELAITQGEYVCTNSAQRKKILFYARPVTPRRGFELGVLALDIFHKKHPEYEINFIGWDTAAYDIPFPYVNNGILTKEQLNSLYNECAAALALSFTSMSLLPVELMSTGCVPVVNDHDYTRMVGYADGIAYAEANPQAIADTLNTIVSTQNLPTKAQELAEYAKQFTWEVSDKKLLDILKQHLA